MQRDRNLIRAILEHLAAHPEPWAERPAPNEVNCQSVAVFSYHISLCEQAGFLAVRRRRGQPQQVQLTWDGHETLEAMQGEQ